MGRNWQQTVERYYPDHSSRPITYVATIDGAPAGMASLRDRDSYDFLPGTTPWICNVYVHDAMRGLGLAGSLCRRLLNEAGRLGFEHVYLASSIRQDSLYHRLGFRQVAEVDYFGPKYILSMPADAGSLEARS
nr:GNAT family N-acetyltransferase [Agrobacterium tumefaciens]